MYKLKIKPPTSLRYGFTNYLFITLTFSRDQGCRHTRWRSVNKLCNRYLQNIRRRLPKLTIEHIRTIEQHNDKNPHVHILLHINPPIRTENTKYIDTSLFRLLEDTWTNGHCKVEVLKYANHPEYGFRYCLKYITKEIYNKNTVKNEYSETGSVSQIWKLRGRRLRCYGATYNVLAWSRQMQYIYLQEQIKRLVLTKNLTRGLRDYHPRVLEKLELSERDLKLLHKYTKSELDKYVQSSLSK